MKLLVIIRKADYDLLGFLSEVDSVDFVEEELDDEVLLFSSFARFL